MSRRLRVTAALSLLLLFPAAPAAAQVNTCLYPDGTIVYSDKACPTLGAERAPDDVRPRLLPRYRNSCVRDVQALMIELSTAIEIGDVNQLAALYHWTGLSTRAGYDIMARLEAIAARPLVDILPVYADPAPAPGSLYSGSLYSGSLYFPPPEAHHPVGIRLEQTLDNGVTPSTTTLRLQQVAGCWWVRL